MIVGVDAGCLGVSDERLKVGVYQVAYNLFKELARIDRVNEYQLFSFYPIEKKIMTCFGSRVRNIVLRPKRGWSKARLPLELKIHPVDVFLGLSQSLPYSSSHNILFVYDLAYEHFPRAYPGSFKKLSKNTREGINLANKILTISNSTKNDLIKLYEAPSGKISVCYPGVGPNFKPRGRKKSFGRPYFFFVGALKKIKNIPRILEGFAYFLSREKKNYLLVLGGGDFWLDEEIEETIKKLSLKSHVVFPGYIKEEDLPSYLRGAIAFVSPSLYEGCGLTLLEAMACGLPVITSNVSAMPEIVGEAGILVSPDDPEDIARGLREVIDYDTTQYQRMVVRGLERTKQFSWKKFAKGVLGAVNGNRYR